MRRGVSFQTSLATVSSGAAVKRNATPTQRNRNETESLTMHGPGAAVARGSDVHMWGAGFRSCGIFRPQSALSAGASVSAGASHQLGLRKVRGIGRPKIKKQDQGACFPQCRSGERCRHAQRRADRRARNGGQLQPEPDLGGAVAHGFRSAVHHKRQVSEKIV